MERCERCQGRGEVPSGYVDMWGRMTWRWCQTCEGTGQVETPKPPEPEGGRMNIPVTEGTDGTLVVGGYIVRAPGFTADGFDAALGRAFMDGLRIAATDRPDMALVTNPRNGASYTTSRTSCSCTAGQRGLGCKHRSYAIFVADVLGELPTVGRVA